MTSFHRGHDPSRSLYRFHGVSPLSVGYRSTMGASSRAANRVRSTFARPWAQRNSSHDAKIAPGSTTISDTDEGLQAAALMVCWAMGFGQIAVNNTLADCGLRPQRPVNVLQAFVRTALVCLVIPPLVFNRDQRGLHDLAVKTVTLRR